MEVVQSRAQAVMVARFGWLRVSGVVLEGGTLTSSAGGCCCSQYGVTSVACGTGWRGLVRFVGTLLGPEGAGNRCFWQGLPASRTVVSLVGGAGLAGSCGGCLVVR